MEYLFEYLLFLAEVLTVAVAVLAVVVVVLSMSMRHGAHEGGRLVVRSLNERLDAMRSAIEALALSPAESKARRKADRKARKRRAKQDGERPRVFVLDFDGDIQASQVEHFSKEVSGVLTEARKGDEVVVRLESPGGMVHGYGLAASQMARLRVEGVRLVAAVDKVAASGGYLMAVLANHIIAAPFAIVGSIGVIAQIPNVHRLLKQHQVDVDVLTAGEFKRTLTVFGENTAKGRAKFVEELNETHGLFKRHVAANRSGVDVDAVATGEAWHAELALERGLVDEIKTSDQYLLERAEQAEVLEVRWEEHRSPVERLLEGVGVRLGARLWQRIGRLGFVRNWTH